MGAAARASYEQVPFVDRASWRSWLAEHHATSPGVWAVVWRQGTSRPALAYDDLLEEALAFGWVDSQIRKLDDERTARLVTPRRPRSRWSRRNKEIVARLDDAGRLEPAGRAAVDAARASGTWEALDEVEALVEPADLAAALDAVPAARAAWDGFPRSPRRAILEWISTAKAEATRARRIATTVEEAAAGRRANQPRQPRGAP